MRRAALRLGGAAAHRRADAGQPRLPAAVMVDLRRLLLEQERPRMVDLLSALRRRCRRRGEACPSRATVYKLLHQIEGHSYDPSALPEPVRAALYNLNLQRPVPGHQLAFYCFHHGDLRALSFASGMPWLDLYQAARTPGWRPRTRALLDAVLEARGIA
ncbi:MAG: hypothetical protein JXR83_02175 [Deltaproteobacteria bacterium]|nr:hypothetical protein [Deltaproteobacteria bacterium]